MNRRQFLASGLASGVGLIVPQIACASLDDYWERDRVLWLQRGRKEQYRVTYWADGELDQRNYERLCYLLRDAEEETAVLMDPALLDLLYGVQYWQELLLHRPVPLIISSGFRTERHNAKLERGASNSMHLYGKAADIQSSYFTPNQLADMAGYFHAGGLGRYDTHTHVDTGRVRAWDKR